VEIETIQQLMRAGRYQVELHAVQHALQEGFDETGIRDAILNGQIIEMYPERRRMLICGQFTPLPAMLVQPDFVWLTRLVSIRLEKAPAFLSVSYSTSADIGFFALPHEFPLTRNVYVFARYL